MDIKQLVGFKHQVERTDGFNMFRPKTEPARSIYDAFQTEAKNRPNCHYSEWIEAERVVVWQVARRWAKENEIVPLSLKEIERAEDYASGHVDYGAKWAYRVAEMLQDRKVEND